MNRQLAVTGLVCFALGAAWSVPLYVAGSGNQTVGNVGFPADGSIVIQRLTTAPTPTADGIAWVDSEGYLTYSNTSLAHNFERVCQKAHAGGCTTVVTLQTDDELSMWCEADSIDTIEFLNAQITIWEVD